MVSLASPCKNLFLPILTLALLSLGACDQCKDLECAYDDLQGRFRIVNAQNNNDLVFGPNKIYERDKIRFFYLSGADTINLQKQITELGPDTILQVNFADMPTTTFMRLSDGDIDTIYPTYRTRKTKCCGTVRTILSYNVNQKQNIEGSELRHVILK